MRLRLLLVLLLPALLCPASAASAPPPPPVSDTWAWSPLSSVNAPSPRRYPSVTWMGHELLVWGGLATGSSRLLNSGSRYDPSSDTWTPLPTQGAPRFQVSYQTAWTGHDFLV